MFRKTFTAMALGLMIAGAGASGAKADVDITINLGYGGFYGKNISCATGARIVSQRFKYVQINECHGKSYGYYGKRNGKWFYIKVSAYSGTITDVKRVYR